MRAILTKSWKPNTVRQDKNMVQVRRENASNVDLWTIYSNRWL